MKRALLLVVATACSAEPRLPAPPERLDVSTSYVPPADAGAAPHRPTFAEDRAFLAAHGTVIELGAPGTGRVLVSPTYQGRVMTSAVGADEPSLGWVHRAFIESGKVGTAFDNYGGEDRFWLGPEAGQFGLYFAPGAPFAFDQWQTPHALQEGAWDEVATGATDRVVFRKTLDVTNWSKAAFSVGVERTVRLLARPEVDALLGTATGEVAFVAFESKNVITNAGRTPWRPETGLLSIWVLGQFAPNDDGRVIVPFEKGGGGPIVNDAYFGAVPKDRLHVDPLSGVLTFSCDGKQRGKIGLGPARAKPVLGSYSAEAGVLTLVTYDGPKRGSPYVDSTWRQQKTPYAGDVVNSYNDGPTAPGQPALGGFYEIETSSAAAALAPGASASHTHRTFHFRGRREALDPIAKRVLGIGLTELP